MCQLSADTSVIDVASGHCVNLSIIVSIYFLAIEIVVLLYQYERGRIFRQELLCVPVCVCCVCLFLSVDKEGRFLPFNFSH